MKGARRQFQLFCKSVKKPGGAEFGIGGTVPRVDVEIPDQPILNDGEIGEYSGRDRCNVSFRSNIGKTNYRHQAASPGRNGCRSHAGVIATISAIRSAVCAEVPKRPARILASVGRRTPTKDANEP